MASTNFQPDARYCHGCLTASDMLLAALIWPTHIGIGIRFMSKITRITNKGCPIWLSILWDVSDFLWWSFELLPFYFYSATIVVFSRALRWCFSCLSQMKDGTKNGQTALSDHKNAHCYTSSKNPVLGLD